MKHISDNVKMNNLLLTLKEKESSSDRETYKDSNVQWITKHIIETLTNSELAIIGTLGASVIVNIFGTEGESVKLIVMTATLLAVGLFLWHQQQKTKEQITIRFNDGKAENHTDALSVLEKYVFPNLVMAEECFETAEGEKTSINCKTLNIVWGEISLRKSIDSLSKHKNVFASEYKGKSAYSSMSLTKMEIDQIFSVIEGAIKKLEALRSSESDELKKEDGLMEALKIASIGIRGRDLEKTS